LRLCHDALAFTAWHAAVPLLCLRQRPEAGCDHCPAKSIPAGQIEHFVVEQIHRILHDTVAKLGRTEISEPLCAVEPRWTPDREARLLGRLLQGVAYDGSKQVIERTFHPNALEAMGEGHHHGY